MQTFYVQVLVVKEVEVEAHDSLQAEKVAYAKLSERDQGGAIAVLVEVPDEASGGALANENNSRNWEFAKDKFHSLDREWVLD